MKKFIRTFIHRRGTLLGSPFSPRSLLVEQRAQAALVDSLFFIGIIATVCSGLFYFAINYGLSTENLLNSFYSSDFATDSLKVITYVNVMRDGSSIDITGNDNLPYHEYDYLLAVIKENFAKNTSNRNKIDTGTRIAIANTLYSVLKPFDDSIDYIFYIARENSGTEGVSFDAVIIATHKCESNNEENCRNGISPPRRVFYSCDPFYNKALEKYVFPYVGKIDSAIGKITLSPTDTSGSNNEITGTSIPHIIGLYTWVSKKVDVMQNPDKPDYQLNCEELPIDTTY